MAMSAEATVRIAATVAFIGTSMGAALRPLFGTPAAALAPPVQQL
ncbi:hypothetical protein USDA257_c20600 [Sinorhizobium fredii USDA 257]|uniref:Uncharacterized protein n=1 Tax=Sinorhizobium fredii (strain USDA 257) TaxID=1185652 RepID=I3X437_SINF2|nr:hypothetical protein USDA257_c20600 [Sinorhizobium fredii USDA 257]